MICSWNELLLILPPRLRGEADRQGRTGAQEIRLRINAPPEVVTGNGSFWLSGNCTPEELQFVVNAASRYSPWAAQGAAEGYLTAPGGHRVGLCGHGVIQNGMVQGIREIQSVCIRVARDFPGIGEQAGRLNGSVLIIGPPGWGKTTLLRDLIRQVAERAPVSVVDERGELFPDGFFRGKRVDVLTGCPKSQGVLMTLRTMAPKYIAVDEITREEDCRAMLQAANCGVYLLAAAHAGSLRDLHSRPVYRMLLEGKVFETVLVLHQDKSYTMERMAL